MGGVIQTALGVFLGHVLFVAALIGGVWLFVRYTNRERPQSDFTDWSKP